MSRHRRDAPPASTANRSCAANRAARSIRSGSSPNDSCRRARGADHPRGQVGEAAERVGERRARAALTAIALIVKSRRRRSSSRLSPYRTTGLRLTPSYASARNVVISSRRPCFCAPIVPNSRPVSQIASAQPLTSGERLLGVGVGAEVEVVAEPAEQRVAHRAADQVQLVAGGGEPAAELVGDGGDAQQLGDGVALGVVQHRHGMTSVSVVAVGSTRSGQDGRRARFRGAASPQRGPRFWTG